MAKLERIKNIFEIIDKKLLFQVNTSVIRKKSNILYLNFDYKFDLQIQIVAIFRKKVF